MPRDLKEVRGFSPFSPQPEFHSGSSEMILSVSVGGVMLGGDHMSGGLWICPHLSPATTRALPNLNVDLVIDSFGGIPCHQKKSQMFLNTVLDCKLIRVEYLVEDLE